MSSDDSNPENFHTISGDDVLKRLNTTADGLTTDEVNQRREKYGWNELEEKEKTTLFDLIIAQFQDILIWILLLAAIISGINGEVKEVILILIILILNAIFGIYQERKAENAIKSLREMTTLECRVLRDGDIREIESKELVPGDIIIIEQGNKIPADARLLTVDDLKVQESPLTGESKDVGKNSNQTYAENTVLGDRKNMVYLGTYVTFGKGKAVVIATGMKTEMGKIAESVQSIEDEKTPFQKKVDKFGSQLGVGILIISAIIIVAGTVLQDREFLEMLTIGVSLAVAAIPEGLPIIITLVLALGVQKMAKHNAIIKKLPVVESLGSTTVIATDKTGTLTKNQMTVTKIVWFSEGKFAEATNKEELPNDMPLNLKRIYDSAILCNNARIKENELGDPTEKGLLLEADNRGYDLKEYREKYQRLKEVPFDSERKRMTVLSKIDGQLVGLMKGAPDIMIDLCDYYHNGEEVKELDGNMRQVLKNKNEKLASQALRVLSFAYRPIDSETTDLKSEEDKFIYVGMMGMIDPPKTGVKEAVKATKTAGIRVIMVTGDHGITAKAIGEEIGIINSLDDPVITGSELSTMSKEELRERVKNTKIFARISPSHKLDIMSALKSHSEIVAMTGDGVNDAPALKGADIGISMGIAGTDVTKETADMILADDNFATIINAVKEGRSIFENMSRFIRYMLSSNMAEILVVFLAVLFDWPIPLVAVQILWINLVTDGLPALAMSTEPPSKNIMERPPRDTEQPLLDSFTLFYILRISLYITFITLFYYWASGFDENYVKASTIAFSTLAIAQLFNAFNLRFKKRSILNMEFFGNSVLFRIFLLSVLLQMATVHTDQFLGGILGLYGGTPINDAFNTVPLAFKDWLIIFLVAFSTIFVEEIYKLILRKKGEHQAVPDLAIDVPVSEE